MKYMHHGKRKRFTTADFDHVLKMKNIEVSVGSGVLLLAYTLVVGRISFSYSVQCIYSCNTLEDLGVV